MGQELSFKNGNSCLKLGWFFLADSAEDALASVPNLLDAVCISEVISTFASLASSLMINGRFLAGAVLTIRTKKLFFEYFSSNKTPLSTL